MENEFPGTRCVGGKYSPGKHVITLYKKDIEIQCKRLLGSLERLEEYTWIIFAHELGLGSSIHKRSTVSFTRQ
ncbi:hypothetical protein [Bacillus sp. CECT 9360]|uniref:hypothetical protein n=1 Tax=Bacillus sp. CECT 9360 TaxID=2845821 RepID=UPI001E4D53F2|nr:hypothetical protein [Bacillus sp. CECT 9360]